MSATIAALLPCTAMSRYQRFLSLGLLALLLAGCSSPVASGPSSGMATMPVIMPDGSKIRAELAVNVDQQLRGLMFRDHLGPEQGMLFVFMETHPRGFWMYQTKIPLDIVWLDGSRTIVEISESTPPCLAETRDGCPSYGGSIPSRYVLELAAGQVATRGLAVGDQLTF